MTMLASENFKIPSSTRTLQDAQWIINGQKVSIKVKVHPEWDVWEYVSGVPAACIGQQLFTYRAALREVQKAGKSLPSDISVLEAAIASMSGETELQKYKNYFVQTGVNMIGCYSSWSHVFDDIGTWSYYWFDDATRVNMNPTTWGVARRDETMWYSVRVG